MLLLGGFQLGLGLVTPRHQIGEVVTSDLRGFVVGRAIATLPLELGQLDATLGQGGSQRVLLLTRLLN